MLPPQALIVSILFSRVGSPQSRIATSMTWLRIASSRAAVDGATERKRSSRNEAISYWLKPIIVR